MCGGVSETQRLAVKEYIMYIRYISYCSSGPLQVFWRKTWPSMEKTMVSSVDARDALSELLNRAAYGKERLVLTRRGKPLAALIPLEDLELIEEIEKRVDLEEARSALREAEAKGSTAWEQVRAELDL